MQLGIYAYEYLVNAEYIDKATAKKLVEDGFVDMNDFIGKHSIFIAITQRCDMRMTGVAADFIDLSMLHLNEKDAKHVKEYYEAVNTTNNMDIPIEKNVKYVDDFIYVTKNDDKARFSLTYAQMPRSVKMSNITLARIFRGVLSSFNIDGIDYDAIALKKSYDFYYNYIDEIINKYKSFDMSMDSKVYTRSI